MVIFGNSAKTSGSISSACFLRSPKNKPIFATFRENGRQEVLGHVTDAERIFAYRLLRIARGDQTPLASFEQDGYIRNAKFLIAQTRRPALRILHRPRSAPFVSIRSLDDAAWLRRGTASQKEVSVLALAFVIAGHERHHRVVLEKHYLAAAARFLRPSRFPSVGQVNSYAQFALHATPLFTVLS